jgi:hypothetical protein
MTTVKISTLPAASVCPPSKEVAAAELGTVIVVWVVLIPEASVVSTLIDEYLRVIGLPYFV